MRRLFLVSHPMLYRLFLLLRQILDPGSACDEERAACGRGTRDKRNTTCYLSPKHHPDQIGSTSIEVVAACSDNVGNDRKDAKTKN